MDAEMHDKTINDIYKKLERRARLEQLSEECNELAKACLKLVRAEGNGNPCTITEEEAIDSVIEEYSDVTVAADALMQDLKDSVDYDIYDRIEMIAEAKIKRWNDRLERGSAHV